MYKSIFLFFILFISLNPCLAQKEYNNWYFGQRASLNFQTGNPRVQTNSEMFSWGACVSISDKNTGGLLFYSNAASIWNRKHQIMPNGKELKGDSIAYKPVFAVPLPGQTNKYCLFTIERIIFDPYANIDSLNLYYSVLDMNLDNGLGDIVDNQKNIPLLRNVSGGMTVVPHQNGQDFWLITHTNNSGDFYVYLINAQGIQTPHIQSIGGSYLSGLAYYKASPNGQKLACAITTPIPYRYQPFKLFDFDAQNGVISNPIILGYYPISVSVSFSPDNSKLYLSGFIIEDTISESPNFDLIAQFDLSSNDQEEIFASRTFIAISNPRFNYYRKPLAGIGLPVLEIAPDGKIYGSGGFGSDSLINYPTMLVIARPNRLGFDCEISLVPFNFGTERTVLNGLPSQIQNVFNNLEPVGSNICTGDDILVYPNPSRGKFNLEISEDCDQVRLIRLFNALGQEIIRKEITSGVPNLLDIEHLASGMYFLEIQFLNAKITKKIIKE